MIKRINNIVIEGKHGRPIVTDTFYNNEQTKKSVVIFCHGYKGFKDWGAWDLVASEFAKRNYFFIKFNFSHNGGTVETPIDFPDLEAFGKNNFSIELDDLESVIDWVHEEGLKNNTIDTSSISLIGHSRGGGIVTLKAAEDKRITNIISWAGVSDFGARFPSGKELAIWKENGVAFIENARTKQQMPHYIQFYEDFIRNQERFNISRACRMIAANHLIIHGEHDDVVPITEANNLNRWNDNSILKIVPDTGHTFHAMHPWNSNTLPTPLCLAIETTIEFLENGN